MPDITTPAPTAILAELAPHPPAPGSPPPTKPLSPATLLPVTNGFVLLVGGAPYAVAESPETLGVVAAQWARGIFG